MRECCKFSYSHVSFICALPDFQVYQMEKAPIFLYTLIVATEFWIGHGSWRNCFALGLVHLLKNEGKCLSAVTAIVPPDNLPKCCLYKTTPLLYVMAIIKRDCRTPSLLSRAVPPIYSPLLIRLDSHDVPC